VERAPFTGSSNTGMQDLIAFIPANLNVVLTSAMQTAISIAVQIKAVDSDRNGSAFGFPSSELTTSLQGLEANLLTHSLHRSDFVLSAGFRP
jgi:hypothetical protein